MRMWLLMWGLFSLTAQAQSPTSVDTAWLTTAAAQEALRKGTLTSEALVSHYLAQIALIDQQGPSLSAIIDLNPDALAHARQLDKERQAGQLRSALHGLPVVLKANIATADKMPTTAGALALKGHLTPRDAALVTQLRDAGAIILAKTNLSEWANFRGENSSSGWSALGGQTLNPHLLSHSPCGSSSGSAVAVAADLSLLAVGTETDGSIICPSSVNGIVGIKPTRGAIDGEGIIPIASAQDTAGPMARTVYGAALLLESMLSEQAQSRIRAPLSTAAQRPPAPGKVALVRAFDSVSPDVKQMTSRTKQVLEAAGWEVKDIDRWALSDALYEAEFSVLVYEYKRDLSQWLRDYQVPESVNSIAKIIAFNQATGSPALAFYGQEYLEMAERVDIVQEKTAYEQALLHSRTLAEDYLNQYLSNGYQAIIIPSGEPAWPINHEKGDTFTFGSSTAAAVAGYPSLTLPAGVAGVLPLGMSVIGMPWTEAQIISLGALLEQGMNAYVRPRFLQLLPTK